MSLHGTLTTALFEWINLLNNNLPDGISALNFGLQEVYCGYEFYLEGFTWYDEASDIWLLDPAWSPDVNYISLAKESATVDLIELSARYQQVICEWINSKQLRIPATVSVVTVCMSGGWPSRIK